MEYTYLAIAVITFTIQTLCFREFGKRFIKNLRSYFLFQGFSFTLTVVLLLLYNGIPTSIHPLTLYIGISFGFLFVFAIFSYITAMESGSMALSALLFSFGLVIPVIYGLFFWDETVKIIQWCGLFMLLLSFSLGSKPKGGEKKFNKKWLIWALFGFLGNGTLMTISKSQAKIMAGEEAALFLIIGFTSAAILAFTIFIIRKYTQKESVVHMTGSYIPLLVLGNGTTTAVGNMLVMILAPILPSVIQYPIQSGGLVITTALMSMVIYKERITVSGYISLAIGICAIVMLGL